MRQDPEITRAKGRECFNQGNDTMSNQHAFQTSSDGSATVVVVVPSPQNSKGVQIARALESAALAFYNRSAASERRVPGDEAALMRQVEAEVYGTD